MTSPPFSKSRLARGQGVLKGYVERGEVPGLVALVSRRGETQVVALGAQSLGGAPMQRETIFRLASLTKLIAAAGAMALVEQCRLRLDDPVDRFLPELADRRVLARLDGPLKETVPAERPISLRDLLTLRMGLGHIMQPCADWPIRRALDDAGLLPGTPQPQQPPAMDAWLRKVGALPLMHQPGARWTYDLSLDVLGALIARASGQALDAFLQETILGPLGMHDTAFSVPTEKRHRLATSYAAADTGLAVYDAAEGGQWSTPPAFPAAASGLVSTADDYLAFLQMMLQGGRWGQQRVLARASVELMTMDHLAPAQRTGPGFFLEDHLSWGFGCSVALRRFDYSSNPGVFGWTGGLGTSAYADPREGLVGVLMTQRMMISPEAPPIYQDFWTGAYQALED